MSYPTRITKAYIKDTYNLNDERKCVPDLRLVDDLENALDLSPDKEYSAIQFYSKIERSFKLLGVDVVKVNFGDYNLYQKIERLETNEEVVDRLQLNLVNQRKGEELVSKERAEYKRLKGIYGYEELICSECIKGRNYTGMCKDSPDTNDLCSSFESH